MSTWKMRTLGTFAFLAAILLFCRIAAYTLRPDDEHVRTRLENFYAEPADTLDVVFVGSSAAYSFFSPLRLYAQTGLTSAVYATPNQSIPMIRYVLEDCRRTQPDALYVIELRAMLASQEDKESIAADLRRQTDNMPYSLTRSAMIADLAQPQERISMQWDLIKYHGRWKQFSPSQIRFRWGKSDLYKGWVFSSGVEPLDLAQSWERVNARISPEDDNERELRALLSYCRANEIRVLFTVTPFPLSRRQAKIYNAVGDVVIEYGYPFLNLCRAINEMELDFTTDYADFRHTNMRGAVKCTDYLGRELLNHISPRGTADEEQWKRCLAAYSRMESESLQAIQARLEGSDGD